MVYKENNVTYCCPDKCFVTPKTQVDGLACRQCGCFSYCKCRCVNFEKRPTPLPENRRRFYKTADDNKYTCCDCYCERLTLSEMIARDFCFNCIFGINI